MDLWIRSQDKNLLTKTNYVEYSLWNEQHRIYCNGEVVAIYDSKERALEILDEIQNILVPKIKYTKGKINGSFNGVVIRNEDTMEIKEFSAFVYEMPKE